MNQVLSQSEVDALLAAVSDGEIDSVWIPGALAPSSSDETVVVVYDLTSQDRNIRGRLPSARCYIRKFMRAFLFRLSSALRKIAI